MPVTIQLTGAGLRATGRILSVSGSLDPATRSLAAKASLASGSGLVPGQAVSVSIATGHDPRRSGVSILAAAVTRIEGSDFVFVSESKRFVRRKVTVVASGEDRAVVSAGLKPGESVAVSGVAELKSILGGE